MNEDVFNSRCDVESVHRKVYMTMFMMTGGVHRAVDGGYSLQSATMVRRKLSEAPVSLRSKAL